MRTRIVIPLLLGIVSVTVYWLQREPASGAATSPAAGKMEVRTHVTDPGKNISDWHRSATAPETASSLAALGSALKSLPPAEAVSAIRRFMQSGGDKPTGLEFVIGSGNQLTGWPTLRTFLLDLLAAIDPAEAAALGREILATPTTPDEWAIALRNVGRVDTSADAREFLRAKTEELIRNPQWQEKPTIGYLNAFDALVHTGATESTPLLSGLIQRKDRKDLAHAGFLTLDRLVQRQPVPMLRILAADSALHQSRPEMVAQQFARADLRDAPQREIVKDWLLDPARKPMELRAFAASYPNNNQMISNNLLTSEITNSGADLATHDRQVLEIITGWQADPALQSITPYLQTIATRLAGFVTSPGPSDTSPVK